MKKIGLLGVALAIGITSFAQEATITNKEDS